MADMENKYPAIQAEDRIEDTAQLNARAACLINPASGIANDFLNHFNEILLLVENLPILLPEMIEELLQWTPTTYSQYFTRSKLPGSAAALARYEAIVPRARAYFDRQVDHLNSRAVDIVNHISAHRDNDGDLDPDKVSAYCEVSSSEFRRELDLLAMFVNCGYEATVAAAHRDAGCRIAS